MSLALSERAGSVLAEGRQAYLAVDSLGGPHVTPELYAWSDGQLWMAVASSTLKARVLRQRPKAGALVGARDRSVVMRGHVDIIDLRRPSGWLREAASLPVTARAVTRFTVRNVDDLVAFGGDLVSGRLGLRLPAARLLLRLTPSAAALVEGDAITERWGTWADAAAPTGGPIGSAGQPAVVGLPGPVALPGRWLPDAGEVHLMPELLQLVGATVPPGRRTRSRSDSGRLDGWFPMGVVVDDYVAPGPASKQGTLHRGRGRETGRAGVVELQLDRAVQWQGVDTTASVTD